MSRRNLMIRLFSEAPKAESAWGRRYWHSQFCWVQLLLSDGVAALKRKLPAVNDQRVSSHITRVVRSQKRHHCGHFIRLAETRHRNLVAQIRPSQLRVRV